LTKGDPPAKARGRACRYEIVIKSREICGVSIWQTNRTFWCD